MSYGSQSSRLPYSVTLKGVVRNDDGLVPYVETQSGTFPARESFRGGYNDPRNFYLMSLLHRTKPKRVRFIVRKIIVGYRFIYKKVWYDQVRQKRVRVLTGRTGYYRVKRRVKRGKNKGKMRWFVKSKAIYSFRYITVRKQRFRKVPVRVPIKVRVRVPILIPPVGEIGDLPAGRRPYLLPNSLIYEDYKREVYPRTNTSRTTVMPAEGELIYECIREGAVTSVFPNIGLFPGMSFGVGYPSFDTTRLPAVDDIYLSATALHGLYKKVASDVPSTLTSLAEAPETVKAVYEILSDGIKLAKSLRKLDARSAYRIVNSAVKARKYSLSGVSSKVWLSWYLAVSPTISDISEHLSLISREDRLWKKFSKSATDVVRQQTTEQVEGYNSTHTVTTTIKYGCYINGRLTIDQFKSKVSGPDNQSAALYAVIPFSFIADWIVDVSTYLESAAVFQGLDYDAWKTSCTLDEYVEKTHIVSSPTHVPKYPPQVMKTDKVNTFISRKFRVDREPLYGGLPEMPLIPWKRRLVDETLINRSLTAASLFRVLASSKN